MAEAKRDENRTTTIAALSSESDDDIVLVQVNPATGAVLAEVAS
jgi:hypothetical protein